MDEIDNLFDEYEQAQNENQPILTSIESDIETNLKQLKYLIDYFSPSIEQLLNTKTTGTLSINSSNSLSLTSSSNDSTSNFLHTQLTNLNELFDYYKSKSELNKTFILYLITKRLNYFNNTLFNLNKKLIFHLNQKPTDSLLDLYSNYLFYDKFETNIQRPLLKSSFLKLKLNSIDLNQLIRFCTNIELNIKFECTIFQFEKCSLNLRNSNELEFLTKKKKFIHVSKRSSSADPRSNKKTQDESSDSESDLENELLNPGVLKLNEKCLKLNKFEFEFKKNPFYLLKPIDLHFKTNKLIIIVYKKVQNNELRIPILYELYEFNNENGLNLSLKSSISPVLVSKKPKIELQNASMFRRMFKSKSKSKSRSNSNLSAFEPKFELNSNSILNVSLSSSSDYKHFVEPVNLVDLTQLDKWLTLWQPEISLGMNLTFKPQNETKNSSELFNIYFNSVKIESIQVKRRSKFDQHQISKLSTEQTVILPKDEENSFYFLKLDEYSFCSNLFKSNEIINDLCQIRIENKSKIVKFKLELFKLTLNQIYLVGSSVVCLNKDKKEKIQVNFNLTQEFSGQINSISLKLTSLALKSNSNSSLLNSFNLNETNEFELYNLVENLNNFNDFILIPKFLEFFSYLSKAKDKTNLLLKLFDCFVRLILNFNRLDFYFKDSVNIQPKQVVQCVLNILKILIDSKEDISILENTLKCFDFIIKLLVDLSKLSNCLFELKYNLNDLILNRLVKQIKLDESKKNLVEKSLNFNFLNHLNFNELFNGQELANLSIKLLGLDETDQFVNCIIQILNLDLIISNYQFRDRLMEILLPNLDKLIEHISTQKCVDLIKSFLKSKLKLNKSNLDYLIRTCLRYFINFLVLNFKENSLLIESFLCLVEILDLILIKTFNYSFFEQISEGDLINLFEIIEHYFRLKKDIFNTQFRVCIKVDLILVKFLKYIQKYLLRQMINTQIAETSEPILFKAYFKMCFSFLKQKNFNFFLFNLKSSILECSILFWKNLNIKLKKCSFLNEFLISKLVKSLVNNCYFKTLKLDDVELNSHAPILYKQNSILCFNQLVVKFLYEIYQANLYDLNLFSQVLFLNLIEAILKNEKLRKIFYKKFEIDLDEETENSSLKSYSKFTLEIIENIFQSNQIYPKKFLDSIKLAFDYNFLKESYDLELNVSVIEKFLFIYNLLKKIDNLNEDSIKNLNESKRKIKLYLLDDLYQLNKSEKNYLQMSFIRKQQADLLEWNYSNKNESDLKEILYLKSLKKFAINSLHEKFLVQESAFLSEYYKSLENKKLSNENSLFTSIQFEICKQLCGYYEKLDENCLKFTRILNAESKFAQLASNSIIKTCSLEKPTTQVHLPHHGHLYFRIGFFGKCLKFESIQNRYFLYKHKSYEMLSNIQNLIKNKLSYSKWSDSQSEGLIQINNVALLHHNQEPDAKVKESKETCFIQICAVNKIEKAKLLELIEEMSEQDEKIVNILQNFEANSSFYYFDRPFYAKNSENKSLSVIDEETVEEFERVKEQESVENLWIERSVLILDEISVKYENLSQYEEIKFVYKILLNPIRNAISDINEKTKELKHFVVQFTTNNSNNTNLNIIHSLQPLTMRLLGCLDARVNGGLIKYVKELLNENVMVKTKYCKNKQILLSQLYQSIKDQLNVLESGLSIHDRILKDVEIRFRDLSANVGINGNLTSRSSEPSENYSEHIKHMNELNKHLIECLKIIENELNERWSKFS